MKLLISYFMKLIISYMKLIISYQQKYTIVRSNKSRYQFSPKLKHSLRLWLSILHSEGKQVTLNLFS